MFTRVFYICFQGVFGCFKAGSMVFQVYFKGAFKTKCSRSKYATDSEFGT